jgi:hypothetical protein
MEAAMPEFRFGDDDYHENREMVERSAPFEEVILPTPPDGMTREEWLQALGYSAPRPPETDKEPSSKDRIHEKQLKIWRGWSRHD